MLVMKFGGSSIKDAESIRRVGEIIRGRTTEPLCVVFSAVGETTDDLKEIGLLSARRDRRGAYNGILEILSRFRKLCVEFNINETIRQRLISELESDLKTISEEIHKAGHIPKHVSDALMSLGETATVALMSAVLDAQGLSSRSADARQIIRTDSNFGQAAVNLDETRERVEKQLSPVLKDHIAVIQGFMGADTMNRTTTLGRGGSDYSATLLGSLLDADRVEIWSDVDGILTADPTMVPDARRIRYMSLHEASELAYFGAKVMHPASLLPALRKNIPVDVLNSTNPSYAGTRIGTKKQTPQLHGCPVKSIAYKEGITVIKVTSTRMLMAHGFMASIFEIFDRFKTPVDLISTSEVSVSITVDQSDHLQDIFRELSRVARVDVLGDKAIVCLVGDDLNKHRGIPGQVFSILQDITIDQISQGASEINISFVIDEGDIETVVSRLHNSFFQGHLDPTIFDPVTIESIEEE